jgi:hypothetical protein
MIGLDTCLGEFSASLTNSETSSFILSQTGTTRFPFAAQAQGHDTCLDYSVCPNKAQGPQHLTPYKSERVNYHLHIRRQADTLTFCR